MTEIEPGVRRELPDERMARVMRDLEADLATFVDSHVLGTPSPLAETLRSTEEVYEDLMRRQGMEDVEAVASQTWGCPMPLEPEPPTFYPGLEVEIKRIQGIPCVPENGEYPRSSCNELGTVVAVDGDDALVRPYNRIENEACLASQLVPQSPPLERRYCSHEVGHGLLTRLKLRIFGNAGRCPLHGLHLQGSISVRMSGRLSGPQQVYVSLVEVR